MKEDGKERKGERKKRERKKKKRGGGGGEAHSLARKTPPWRTVCTQGSILYCKYTRQYIILQVYKAVYYIAKTLSEYWSETSWRRIIQIRKKDVIRIILLHTHIHARTCHGESHRFKVEPKRRSITGPDSRNRPLSLPIPLQLHPPTPHPHQITPPPKKKQQPTTKTPPKTVLFHLISGPDF